MRIEAFVRLLDQLLVETSFTDTRFVASDKQDGLSLGVKGQRDPPDSASGGEAKLLHVGMPRPVQGVHPRAAQRRSECLKKLRPRKQLIPHFNR